MLDENISNGETFRLTTLFALERFLSFQADDRNRNQRGGGVYPADMKHRIEDQSGKGYAGKVGTRSSIRLSAPKAKSTGLRARHAEKRARAHSTTIQISVTTCNRTIWRDLSTEVPAHPEAWVNVPRPASSSKLIVPISPPPGDTAWHGCRSLPQMHYHQPTHTPTVAKPSNQIVTSRCGGPGYACSSPFS